MRHEPYPVPEPPMLTPIAFLQTGPDAIACVEGRIEPVAYPRPGSAAFFAPDFRFSTGRPWWFDTGTPAPRTWMRAEWRARFDARGRAVAPAWRDPDEPRFAAAFRSLRGHLDAGVLRKGVPVTAATAALSDDQAVSLFHALLGRVASLPPGVLAYGFYLPPGRGGHQGPEYMVGATPEVLFDFDGCRSLATVAVAGTRPAAEVPADLESNPKERDEHQAVVEDLLAQLSEWGEARAAKTEVRRFGQLAHLVADIRLHARAPLDFETVARRLHPTPALGVYPRGAAGDAWLASVDPGGERKRFGAPFGLRLPSGGGRCVVAIRNVQFAAGRLEIWAGCGVVPMSRYGEEWTEVVQKVQAVRALWGI